MNTMNTPRDSTGVGAGGCLFCSSLVVTNVLSSNATIDHTEESFVATTDKGMSNDKST